MNQRPEITLLTLPSLPEVEWLTGRTIASDFRRHVHRTYIIGLVESGTRLITCPTGEFRVAEQELFVLHPGQVHACRCESTGGHCYRLISVSARLIQAVAAHAPARPGERPLFDEIVYHDRQLVAALRHLFSQVQRAGDAVSTPLMAFLADLLCHSRFAAEEKTEQNAALQRVCDYIERHCCENPPLEKLAEIACLSPFHFHRQFRKRMGITPHEYLSSVRIRKSRQLLRQHTDLADIAYELTFADQSHFSRTFKRNMGISPGRCRILPAE